MTSSTPASTTARSGGCLCGKVQFTVTGEPDYPHTCSCQDCQGLSGAPMMSWVSFPLDGLAWSGAEPSWHYTWPDSKRGFCPSCVMQAEHVSRHVVSHGWRMSSGQWNSDGTGRGPGRPPAHLTPPPHRTHGPLTRPTSGRYL
ncbi:GFA family protein [Streptomyces sp. NPDC057430]|uniref:GFA family protein n=1 Tax=Streptomyces sp. NPDC057430 TaxID=3346131 RepID=UPI003680376D